MKKMILIIGGQRSGKSVYAEKRALSLSSNPVYLATAHVWDEEFRERVRRHQERRRAQWTNIEEEKYLSRYDVNGRVVLVDCLTLWATNFLFQHESGQEQPVDETFQQLKKEFDQFVNQNATFIFVTNEIGLGGVSADAIQRHFSDLLGMLNQYVAGQADEVTFMAAGIPMKVK